MLKSPQQLLMHDYTVISCATGISGTTRSHLCLTTSSKVSAAYWHCEKRPFARARIWLDIFLFVWPASFSCIQSVTFEYVSSVGGRDVAAGNLLSCVPPAPIKYDVTKYPTCFAPPKVRLDTNLKYYVMESIRYITSLCFVVAGFGSVWRL